MRKYSVCITEINRGAIIIEANSKEDAESLAMDVYYDGETHWTDSEITELEALELESSDTRL
jgi:uncharacterized protein YciI